MAKKVPHIVECRSGLFCAQCRDRAAGFNFRRGLVEAGVVREADFACPLGQPWGAGVTAAAIEHASFSDAVLSPQEAMERCEEAGPDGSDCEHLLRGGGCELMKSKYGCNGVELPEERPCLPAWRRAVSGLEPLPDGCPLRYSSAPPAEVAGGRSTEI